MVFSIARLSLHLKGTLKRRGEKPAGSHVLCSTPGTGIRWGETSHFRWLSDMMIKEKRVQGEQAAWRAGLWGRCPEDVVSKLEP